MKIALTTNSGTTTNLTGTVVLTAAPVPSGQVDYVEFFVDDVLKSTDTSSPFTYSWDTRQVAAGGHQLKARAYFSRNKVEEVKLSVTVASTPSPPPPPPVQGPPVNTTAPAISGTATEGQTLSVLTGTWTNSPSSYTRQWLRCDAGGANPVAIPSATGMDYVLAAADVGATIRCAVTAYNSYGASAVVNTAQTAVVAGLAPAVPVNVAPPVITGTATQGNVLTVSNGSWTNAPTSYLYQWRRCDAAGAACVDIAGATTLSYSLTTTDVGKTLRCKVTARNASGSSTPATTNQTAAVAAPPSGTWTTVASEGQVFTLSSAQQVRYGITGAYTTPITLTGTITCDNATFGDPAVGSTKHCDVLGGTAPPPPTGTLPSVISAGGTYSGTIRVSQSGPAVRITTSSPVVIQDALIENTGDGAMLECLQAGAQVTIRRTTFNGGRWRGINANGFKSFEVTNCNFNHCWGCRFDNAQASGSIIFLRNKNSNTQRYLEHPHFFQCANNPDTVSIEVAWNQSINVFGQSDSEDVINIYSSSNALVHDNGIRGAYPDALATGYSGGGIIIDGPVGHNNKIYNNHVVDCMNYGVSIAGGYNGEVYGNRVVCDGRNDAGQPFTGQSSGGIGAYVADFSSSPNFSNNQLYNNVIGVLSGAGTRNDWWLPDCSGQCSNTTMSGTINKALEDAEWQRWLDKLAANGVTVGV